MAKIMDGIIFGGQLEDFAGSIHKEESKNISMRRSSGGHKIATFLRQNGYNIDVVDYVHRWKIEQLKEYIKPRAENCKFFGFGSTFFLDSPVVKELVEWLKQEYPNIPRVAGSQNDSMRSLDMDWYVYGYGENAMLELLKHFDGGPEPIHFNKVINCYVNYKSFPKEDLTVSYQETDFVNPREIMMIEFARGCKFKCKFCSFPILGVKGDYSRTAQSVYDEMSENYDKWGIEHYLVIDETFNDSSEKIEKFANVIEKLPFQPKMTAFIRGDLLASRPRDWDNLIKMGITSHFYGIESMNHKAAKSVGKGMNTGRIQDGLLEVKEYFQTNAGYYKGLISLIAGLPYETIDSLRETVRWCSEYWSDQSYHMNILMIKLLGKPSLNHNSEFDLNWKDYGYRESQFPKDDIKWDMSINPFYKFLYEYVATSGEYIMWENDYTNMYDCFKFCVEEFSQAKLKNALDPFMYDKFFIDPSVKWSDFVTETHMERRESHILEHVDGYIKKKLLSESLSY